MFSPFKSRFNFIHFSSLLKTLFKNWGAGERKKPTGQSLPEIKPAPL
jgi:hypothetical protein